MAKAMQIGDYGDVVMAVQRLLGNIGYRVESTGIYDGETAKAVERFQEAARLPKTGSVDDMTYSAMKEARGLAGLGASPLLQPREPAVKVNPAIQARSVQTASIRAKADSVLARTLATREKAKGERERQRGQSGQSSSAQTGQSSEQAPSEQQVVTTQEQRQERQEPEARQVNYPEPTSMGADASATTASSSTGASALPDALPFITDLARPLEPEKSKVAAWKIAAVIAGAALLFGWLASQKHLGSPISDDPPDENDDTEEDDHDDHEDNDSDAEEEGEG